ncbi:MAG: hypothetical protein J0L54_01995 [Chitinophagales bacterium]|nr:hypothetical protein [Chitinophagales bacterium]
MKQILVLFFLLAGTAGMGQSKVSKVEYQKADREAIVHELPFEEDMVTKAIQDTLEKLGYKGKESKGFVVYKGVKLAALGSGAYDLYFAVDKKSRKEKSSSHVTMMISTGFEEFVTEKSHPELVHNAKAYMDNLRHTVALYDHNVQIAEQEEAVRKVEKKMEDLAEEAQDLQKKMKKLEKEIDDNNKQQADQQKELEKQRQILSTLKGTNGN